MDESFQKARYSFVAKKSTVLIGPCYYCVLFFPEGTLLEQPSLYEDDVNSPENLQRLFFSSFLQLPATAEMIRVVLFFIDSIHYGDVKNCLVLFVSL